MEVFGIRVTSDGSLLVCAENGFARISVTDSAWVDPLRHYVYDAVGGTNGSILAGLNAYDGILLRHTENGGEWNVGVVRRLTRTPQMKVYVGIQVLAHEPVSVRLHPTGVKLSVWENVAEIQAQEYLTALLLPQSVYCLEESCLLLEQGSYELNHEYEMIMRGEKSRLRLTNLFEQGEDFERVGFVSVEKKVLKQ